MNFADALKQLVGLAPLDRREIWHDKPVVIVRDLGEVYFAGTATVEYRPGPQRYEEGHADVFDAETGDLILSADIVGQRTYSTFDQSNPWKLRWSRLGLIANAVDAEGRTFTLYVGRHAHNYILQHRTKLGPLPDDPSYVFPGG